jgi:hypothetical protein
MSDEISRGWRMLLSSLCSIVRLLNVPGELFLERISPEPSQ